MKVLVSMSADMKRLYGYTFPAIEVQSVPRIGECLLIRPIESEPGSPGLTVRARFRVVDVLHAISPDNMH